MSDLMSSDDEMQQAVARWNPEEGTTTHILESFTPLSRSLAWRLGQTYWHRRGAQAFLTDGVPNAVTSDGYLASRNAALLLESCLEAERGGTLEGRIEVVELAVGLGMHAAMFLRCFAHLCQQAGVDYAQRLVYYATDISEKTLFDLHRSGTLRDTGICVELARVDALQPGEALLMSGEAKTLRGVRAIYTQYMLCVLPCDVLLFQEGEVSLLHLQSMLTDTSMARVLDENAAVRAMRPGSVTPEQLLPIHEAVSASRAFLPVERAALPDFNLLERFVKLNAGASAGGAKGALNRRMLHSHGAIQCLRRCMSVLREDGFMVLSDYGSTTLRDSEVVSQHQHFGVSTAMGLNFPLIEFAMMTLQETPVALGIPEHDGDAPVHSRLISRRAQGAVLAAFPALFDGAAFLRHSQTAERSMRAVEAGDMDEARQIYKEAEARFSESWLLHTEWAHLLLYHVKEPQQALARASRAVELNPTSSSRVWNVFGDCLYMLERYEEAHEAFLKALAINPEDPRCHLNLAWTRLFRQELREGLRHIADGIHLDKGGHHRAALLSIQERYLACMSDLASVRDLLSKSRWH